MKGRRLLSTFTFILLFAASTKAQFFEQSIGSGPANGLFDNPSRIAYDLSGNIYVADTENHRIQKFNNAGAFITTWGSYGNSQYQFNAPVAIAVDRSFNIYVVDKNNNRVVKFNSTQTFLLEFGGAGSQAGKFDLPEGIALDYDGNVYIADTGNHRIQKFNSAGSPLASWGSLGNLDSQFRYPRGINVDHNSGDIYVADTQNYRIQKFNSAGTFSLKWGAWGTADGAFSMPTDIATDGAGNVYVVDPSSNRVQKFNSNGIFLLKWGTTGAGDGQFSGPQGIMVDPFSSIIVADSRNHRLQKFNTSGTFTSKWGSTSNVGGRIKTPAGIATDSNGNIYVVDSENHRVQKFNSTGNFVAAWGSKGNSDGQFESPWGIAVDAANNVYVVDAGNYRIQKFNSSGVFISKWGSYGTENGQFISPEAIAISPNGNIYVADEYRNIVQRFNSAGLFQSWFGGPGSADGLFAAPKDIVIDGDGNIYVLDVYNRVQKFNSSGTFVLKWIISGNRTGLYPNPQGLSVDDNGNVYVADSGDNKIKKFTSNGTLQFEWGSQGINNGQFNAPVKINTVGNNTVFVSDFLNRRIQKFSVFSLTSFSPASGISGTTLTLTGFNFSSTPLENEVKINGIPAVVTSATNTTLKVTVPKGASSGKITVKRQGYEVQSATNFSIIPLTIESFSPKKALAGEAVVITGTGFSTTPGEHTVKFNGLNATVTAATATKLTAKVPEGATTGKISVTRDDISISSTGEFLVLPLVINAFNPTTILAGGEITLFGKGFSSTKENNVISINGVTAEVLTSSPTEIRIIVPQNASSGKISVTVLDQTATTQTNLMITKLQIVSEEAPDFFTIGDNGFPVHVTVNDLTKLKKIMLTYYGLCTPRKVKTQEMSFAATTNTFTLEIPASLFTDSLGIGGYLTYVDSEGLEAVTPNKNIYLRYRSDVPSAQIPNLVFGKETKDYQIISIPFELVKPSIHDVFADLGETNKKKWRLFHRIGDEYAENPPMIEPGKGYWLIAKDKKEINPGEGTTVMVTPNLPFKILLKPGWNLIGNPYNFSISWNDVMAFNPTSNIGKLVQYNNGRLQENQLLPRYRGALVKSASEVEIIIPITNRNNNGGRTGGREEEKIMLDGDTWFVPLAISDGKFTNELYGIGMHPLAKEGEDQLDDVTVPLLGDFASFDWTLRISKNKSLSKDIVSTSNDYSWETSLTNHEAVTLNWTNTNFDTTEKLLVIEVDTQVEIVDMRLMSQLTIPPGEHIVKFHFGTEQYIRKQIVGEAIAVGTAFPNPMVKNSGLIQVGVNLPKETVGQLHLLDALGRSVAKSSESRYQAGRYALSWETDFQQLSAGVYYLKVQLGSHHFLRKIVITN